MTAEPLIAETEEIASSTKMPGAPSSPRQSFWRISLGGVLIFAAGMMVGFAPMRAWLFFKDEPEQIMVEAILLEVDETENETVRSAFSDAESSEASRGLDPLVILSGRLGTYRVLSHPMLVTLIDEPITLSLGMSVMPLTQSNGSVVFVPASGTNVAFTPKRRPSGKLQLHYRTTYSESRADAQGAASELDEVGVESVIAARPGEWRLVELKSPMESDVVDRRCRWLLLRMLEDF